MASHLPPSLPLDGTAIKKRFFLFLWLPLCYDDKNFGYMQVGTKAVLVCKNFINVIQVLYGSILDIHLDITHIILTYLQDVLCTM